MYFGQFWRFLAVYELVYCVEHTNTFCVFKPAFHHNMPPLHDSARLSSLHHIYVAHHAQALKFKQPENTSKFYRFRFYRFSTPSSDTPRPVLIQHARALHISNDFFYFKKARIEPRRPAIWKKLTTMIFFHHCKKRRKASEKRPKSVRKASAMRRKSVRNV